MIKKVDLHIHTTMSDGELTPKEVIEEAYKNGVSVISIADHDTIDAYTDEILLYAKKRNIKLISGVEISTKTKKAGIHILGYNFNLKDKKFQEKIFNIRNARHIYLHRVSKKLNELGYFLNTKELDKIDSVTKAHISLDIITNKENNDILLKEFGYIPEKGEFIETVMNENCPAYVEKETVTPKEVAEIIRKAGGKVVLAHPVAYIHEDNMKQSDILDIVEDISPDGIEANYIYVNRNNIVINEVERWNEFAKEHNLFVTIGSDFHNKDGIRPEIGLINTEIGLEDNIVDDIIFNISN